LPNRVFAVKIGGKPSQPGAGFRVTTLNHMLNLWLRAILAMMGVFSVTLGTLHFFFPHLLDFEHAIPATGSRLKPFQLGPLRYNTQRSDVHGIAWVMNHAASFVLVSIGLLNGYWAVAGAVQPLLALWIAGWWFLRAGSQLYLGRRRWDWVVLAGFALLGLIHLALGLRLGR
jgi:hypothetical protein